MMFYKILTVLVFSFLTLAIAPLPSKAQNTDAIEITAAGSLEWDRNAKKYIARKDAVAVRGTSVIKANTLTAYYTETKNGNIQIQSFEATGNVRISLNNEEQKVFGDKAVYNVNNETAVVTGKDLKLITPTQIVTAQKSLEYHAGKKQLVANGNATAKQDDDLLESQKIMAFLRAGSDGNDEIFKLEAHNNVVITTPKEVIKGDKGIYNLDTDLADLTGGVTILRGPNTLLGERAQVDLNTNVSTIYGGTNSPTGNGRVRAVFYPEKLEETNQNSNTEQ